MDYTFWDAPWGSLPTIVQPWFSKHFYYMFLKLATCNVVTTLIPSTCSMQCAVVQKLGLVILHKVGRFGNKARTACSRAPHSDKLVVFQRICLPMIWSDICWNFWCYMEARRTLWSATFFTLTVLLYSTQPHQNGATPTNTLFILFSVIALSSSKLQSWDCQHSSQWIY